MGGPARLSSAAHAGFPTSLTFIFKRNQASRVGGEGRCGRGIGRRERRVGVLRNGKGGRKLVEESRRSPAMLHLG